MRNKMENEMNNFSEKENDTIKRLIRLGDTKELAEKTVIANRDRECNKAFYYNPYWL
jgi:hypothetical protein